MNGVINFLKPPGMSSNGAVVFLRGLLGVKKTGHAGTLDPGACGVLPICVGKATRISDYLMGSEKEYIAEISFGKATDTGDSYGAVTQASNAPLPDADAVKLLLQSFIGHTKQQTPAYSAVKHQGQKLYKLARRGIAVPQMQRDIVIHSAEHLEQTGENAHLIRIVCGKGTYIRTLCTDIGERLGLPSYMSLLVRTKCAGLDIGQAYTADALVQMKGAFEGALLPMDGFLSGLARIDASARDRRLLFNGVAVSYDGQNVTKARVYADGSLLGIGSVYEGLLKISTLLVDE